MIRRWLTLAVAALALLPFGALGADPPGNCPVDKVGVELFVSQETTQLQNANVDAVAPAIDVVVGDGFTKAGFAMMSASETLNVLAFRPEAVLPIPITTVGTIVDFIPRHSFGTERGARKGVCFGTTLAVTCG